MEHYLNCTNGRGKASLATLWLSPLFIIILLGWSVPVMAQSTFSLAAGYSWDDHRTVNNAAYSRRDIGEDGPRLISEDVKHAFMKGVNIAAGYEYSFNKRWSLWGDLMYKGEVSYETLLLRGPLWPTDNHNGIQRHLISAENYAARAGAAFGFGRNERFYRHKWAKQFYFQLRLGLSYNKPVIETLSESTPESQYEIEAKSRLRAYGIGANAALRMAYRFSPHWEVFVQGGAERLRVRHTGMKYYSKRFGGIDELNPPPGNLRTPSDFKFYRSVRLPFHYFRAALGLNFKLGGK